MRRPLPLIRIRRCSVHGGFPMAGKEFEKSYRTGDTPWDSGVPSAERTRVLHAGWLAVAGNAKERTEDGPPVVSEEEFRTELGPLFKILEVHEFRFTLDREDFRPLAWSILMERR